MCRRNKLIVTFSDLSLGLFVFFFFLITVNFNTLKVWIKIPLTVDYCKNFVFYLSVIAIFGRFQ